MYKTNLLTIEFSKKKKKVMDHLRSPGVLCPIKTNLPTCLQLLSFVIRCPYERSW